LVPSQIRDDYRVPLGAWIEKWQDGANGKAPSYTQTLGKLCTPGARDGKSGGLKWPNSMAAR
jgi:hypothetical protein